MKRVNEAEIAKSYEGKLYNCENLRKIAMGYGDTGAVVYYGHLSKKQFELFGITEALLDNWLNHNINYSVVMLLDESSTTIKQCRISKSRSFKKNILTPTQQEIRIFRRIMDYITKG